MVSLGFLKPRRGPAAQIHQIQNIHTFERRLDRVRRAHDRGFGFATPGTLGGRLGGQGPLPRRRIPFFAPLAIALIALFAMKTGLQIGLGPVRYDAQLAMLAGGDALHRAAAQVMAADPISRDLAQWVVAAAQSVAPR